MRRTAVAAPWVRTRLRAFPGAAVALGLLVAVTAFLAAAFPRAVDAYETEGLRHRIAGAAPPDSVVEVTVPAGPGTGEAHVRPEALRTLHRAVLDALPEPVRADAAQSSYGLRTTRPLPASDPGLPAPDGLPPEFTLATPSELGRHATVRAGRLPTAPATATATGVEAAVTADTAEALELSPGSVVHLPRAGRGPLAVRITGVVQPRSPRQAYWSVEPRLRTPELTARQAAGAPRFFWDAALLLPPEAAPVLLGTAGEPQGFWRIAPATGHLTARDAPALTGAVASLTGGPDLLAVRGRLGDAAAVDTRLGDLLASHDGMRAAIGPVVAVAAAGAGTVAVVVVGMAAGLGAARRRDEPALLRARGGSLGGIGGRLLAETAVVAVPAAALGLLLAVWLVGSDRFGYAAAGAGAVALVVCGVLPVRAVFPHRRPGVHRGRDDLVAARPSRRRTVAELTLLALAVAAVAALRTRDAGAGGADLLAGSAPVLVGLVAALVLVRLYPLPLRWAARPARRLRGVVGPLALAGAARSPAAGALTLLALLVALTTAGFGGSVLAGVAAAREEAAVLETGGDARVSGAAEAVPLPDGLVEAVRGVEGVREAVAVQVEYGVPLADRPGVPGSMSVTLIGVEPGAYAELARRTGQGSFPAGDLRRAGDGDGGRVPLLPAVVSPSVARLMGAEQRLVQSHAGTFRVRVAGVRERTPAVPGADFIVVNAADLTHRADTVLLVSGPVEGGALRSAVGSAAGGFSVRLRSEARAGFVESPMQTGAERVYAGAVAAGAGYAALALLLALLHGAPGRAALLARLRTLGLSRRQGRWLLGLEALPQALLAAAGGTLTGWAAVALLSPGVDLARLALAAAPGLAAFDGAPLRADAWSLVLPAVGVVVLTSAVALGQAWWVTRRGSVGELGAGEAR
ncbi:ABC transporter permease [Streptomyces sp. WAC05374]|uniref:FtsX-like permease family protein n=2 Tax=Streptomyces sp. WAC05374 TaxID=2487420 RepID=UPI001056ADFF|nr:FtsX-like permease family protein [Streptomyces sp. WAC05374]TDF44191.1 ABC transporter permease [Streptomyces sp. WAC05374]TDF53878.1 ABC transporter permease [Streptomyces sp. WAC05374]TDF58710.1 ABC transporter permease [Streptomyces sp. WAC05374]